MENKQENEQTTDPEQQVPQKEPPFMVQYTSLHAHLAVQHSEKDPEDKDKTVDHEFKFHSGILTFTDETQHAVFERALAKMHPSVRSTIRKVGDRAAAEAIARSHQAEVLRQQAAVTGPLTAGMMKAQSAEAAEEKVKNEAAAQGAKAPEGLKGLFQSLGKKPE